MADRVPGPRTQTRALACLDNASWHISREVRTWIKTHNRRVKCEGGCRLVVCQLPTKSPWLNRIEPKWVHGKRAIAEPARKLTVDETQQRICDYYHCERLAPPNIIYEAPAPDSRLIPPNHGETSCHLP